MRKPPTARRLRMFVTLARAGQRRGNSHYTFDAIRTLADSHLFVARYSVLASRCLAGFSGAATASL